MCAHDRIKTWKVKQRSRTSLLCLETSSRSNKAGGTIVSIERNVLWGAEGEKSCVMNQIPHEAYTVRESHRTDSLVISIRQRSKRCRRGATNSQGQGNAGTMKEGRKEEEKKKNEAQLNKPRSAPRPFRRLRLSFSFPLSVIGQSLLLAPESELGQGIRLGLGLGLGLGLLHGGGH